MFFNRLFINIGSKQFIRFFVYFIFLFNFSLDRNCTSDIDGLKNQSFISSKARAVLITLSFELCETFFF